MVKDLFLLLLFLSFTLSHSILVYSFRLNCFLPFSLIPFVQIVSFHPRLFLTFNLPLSSFIYSFRSLCLIPFSFIPFVQLGSILFYSFRSNCFLPFSFIPLVTFASFHSRLYTSSSPPSVGPPLMSLIHLAYISYFTIPCFISNMSAAFI